MYLGSTITRSKPNQPGSLSHIYVCAKWTQGMPNGPKASCQVAYQTVAHLASGGQSWQPFAKYPESGAAYWTLIHLSSGLALVTHQVADHPVGHLMSTQGNPSRPVWAHPNVTYQVAYHPVGHLMSTRGAPIGLFGCTRTLLIKWPTIP